MDIELYAFLSTIILGSTVLTMLFALFSYLAFRARENRAARRKPAAAAPVNTAKPLFFRKYEPSK